MGSFVDENRLLLKVPERWRIGTLSAENDIAKVYVLVVFVASSGGYAVKLC